MMPTPCSLTSSLALLVLLGTVRAGPFSPRFNITRPGPRPPPQPGGHTAEPGVGSPSAQLYEHTVEGGEKQVVFTHRINLPPSAGCGCPPGTEPPAPASEVQSLKVRLEILEELVQGLKEQCTGGCCPVTAKAGTGQTDTRSLCSLHGVFDLSRCACSCEPGWGGPTCSDPTDAPVSPSSSPSCPDDCNDQGRCVRGRCECFPGYTGPSCSWPSCPGDCHGRGRCVQGVCVCRPGFSGADCSLRACPRGCSQKGRCEDGRCVCNPGYTGDDCGVKSCPRDCSQRGRCENGRCVCNPGYTGDDCGARSCPRGCSQKGRCEDGRCVCEPGYTGADCGSRSCPWDCGEGGRCVDGRCVCWPGYAGDDCSRRTCPRDCHGRGRCEDGECLCDAGYSGDDCGVRSCPGDCSQRGRCEDGRCVCWPGYTGPDCGAKSCPRDCRGRGRCEAGVCVCHPGYGGDDCGVRSCPGDCRGRGRCESGRCVCWPGYTGRDCGVRACPGDCRGRGRCVDGRCICNPGFAGDDCGSRRCPGDCRGRGRCEDGVCVCDAGYQGEDCGARSCPGGCRGRGQCLDGRCVCDDGYEGEDCGVRRCPRDCSQRGVCQDGVCACWEGYAGEDCGLRTCPSNCHGRGRCEEGRCVCDSGYTGPTCGVRTCPSDCRGHGRCVQGVCVCHPGYSGPDCGQDEPPASACPGGCGPRELCREGRCVCVEGFRGPDCAIQTCPADCLGRGECLEGSCVCQEGYAGEDCSEEIPAIENMRMHLLEETTVRTEWTRGPGTVDAYEIQFIPMTEGMSPPFTARVPSSASAYDQRGLAPGQEYQVTVRALRGTSWGPPASKTITTMIDGPQDLRVVAVTPTTLDLSWLRPQAEVDRFVVSYVSAGNQRVRLEVPPEADRALLTDLMPGVEYVVTVTAERGPAVSYPASIRANTAPGHYSYPEVRPPPPSPQPRPGPQPSPPLLPPRPRRPSRPAEEVGPESRLPPSPPQPPRRPWGNLTAELGRFRGSVQDLERHLRARGYPLRANQTYTAVARHIHEYLLRRQAAPPAPPPRRPHPTASPNAGARKRDSSQGSYDRGTVPRHPKPEVLGFSADGTLLVSLDGLRGHFERMVLRWRPELPADGPGGELTVPGTSRTASLPNLKPSTTYHVEVHGVRAGQTSKSYAFVTTTGSSPTGFLGATDEPPPSGPSTTQGAQAPTLQHRPQELGELRVLGRDMTGRLHVTWTAQPDTFAHFQLTLQVPEGSWVHEELLPGDVHEALVPSPPPGVAYELTLHGVLPSGEPSSPLTYHGIKEKPEKPEKPLTLPRLGELTVTDAASSSLTLHWTVSEGEFDSFVIQYKDRDGPQVVPVEGSQREALITNLELNRKYKFVLYGMVGKKKHGPLVAEAKIVPQSDPISETSPRLGKLWVTDPTPDSLHLSWTVPEGQFDSFLVQYRGKDGQPQVIPVEGPERSATVSQLAPDHKYRFTLFGIANRKRHGPLMAEGTTAPEKKPGHPEPLEQPLLGKLTVNGATPDSLVLSWTVDQGSFDSFMVQYKDAQGQPQAVPVRGHENTVTIRGLESNRKYKMNLYGLHGRHRVGPVSVVASTAPQEVMETPTEPPSTEAPEPPEEPLLGKLTVTGSSQDSLSLSWTVPQGHFDRFLVQYKNGDGQPKVVRVPGTQDWVTISGLEPDHKYKVNLYGFHNGQRVGPISATGVTATEEKTPTETEVTPTEPPSTEAPESPEEPLLGELTVTGSSQDSLSLSWTVPQGHFDRFLVQYKNGDGQPKVVRVPGTQDWVTISGLEPDHKYKVNLYGFHNGQRVGPISATGVTATEEKTPTETEVTPTEPPSTEAPESPEEPLLGELTVTGSSQDSLSLSWTVPQGHFDRFLVQYKNGDGQPKVVRVPGTQDWVTISGLEPDHKYKMNLYGFHNGQRVGPISAFGVTDAVEETPTPTEPPSTEAPEPTVEPLLGELTVTGSSQDSLSLSWTVPQGHFDSFTIQYKDRDGQPQVVRVGGEEREVTVQGLDAGRKYKMHLYGLHGGQRVGPASTVGVTEDEPSPVTTPPLEPRLGQLTVTSVTPSSVGLSWTVPEGKFDSFVVQYKGKDGQPQMVPVSKDQLEVTIPGLEPARKYKMNLYGLQSGQRVGPLSVVAMTAPLPTVPATEPPQEPQLGDLTVTDVTPDSVGLLWTVPGGEFDSFVVQYKDKDGQPQVVPMAADQREATIPGLEPNKKYKFLLFGIKDGKRSSPLSVEAKTVASPGTTPRLGELWVTDPTPDSLHLSWTVPEGHFDSFVVQFKDRDGPRLVPVEGQERSVTITPLDANRKYRFLLYGLLGKKRYGPLTADGTTENRGSQDDTGIKRLPKPRLGEELQVTSVTPDSVDLSWTVTEGHFDSFVVQYKDKDGQPQVVPVEGSLREVRVPDLDPGRRYKLLLYGLHQGKRVGPLSTTAVTGHREDIGTTTLTSNTPAPEVFLGELTVVEATPHTLHLSWIETEGEFDSFEVQFIDQTGKQEVLTVGGDQKDITLYDLESDHRYLVNLYGFHGQQRVGPAQVEALTVLREEEDEPSEPPTISSEPPFKPLLGELTVTGSSQDSLSLSWTIPEGHFDSFVIQYKNGDEQPKIVQVPGHQNWVTISGLEPDHKYKVNLYGFYSDQRVGPISAVGVTDAVEETPIPTEPPSTEAPEPPEEPLLGELTVSGSSQDSLSLSWTVPQGHFDSFTIQYKDKDGQPQVVRVRGEEREVTVRGLDAGRKYKMHLYGLHGGQRVGPVSTVGVTEPEGEPTSPPVKPLLGELTVTGSSQDSLSLSWTVPQGQFDHFLVQYKNGDGQPKVLRVPGTQDWVTISGLEPDHKYKMNLYGFHGDQREGPISTVGVTGKDEEMTPFPTDGPTTTPEPPFKPHLGELTVTGSSQDSLSLSWTVPQGHFDRFLVQYKNGDGQPKVVRVPGTQDWVTISGLEPDHKYKVNLYGFHNGQRVGPISAIGVTDAVEETPTLTEPLSTEAPEPSEEPLLGELTVTGSSQDSLSLSWTVPQGQFDRFLVQYKNGDGQPKVVRVPGTQDWVTISGLEPDHKYKVNLYGFHNGQRVGPISATGVTATEEKTPTETEVTPTEPPSTEAPESPEEPLLGELTVTGSSQDSLSLSWTVPQGHFDRFLVQYKNGDGQPKVVRVPGTQDWVTISGLEPDHKYKVNLYGFHNGQRVGPISAFGVTDAVEETPTPTEPPSTEAPDPPVEPLLGELTVTGSSQDSLSLSWTVPQGHFDSFTIQYKDRDGQPQVVRVGGEEREVTVRGLDAGRKYKMHLYGLHGGQRVGPVSTVGVTDAVEETPTPTEPPSTEAPEPTVEPLLGELTVTESSQDSLSLSWTVPQGHFDSFTIQYKDRDGQPQVVRVGGEEREVTVQGLDAGRKYKMHLYGLHGGQRVGPVSTVGVTVAHDIVEKTPTPTEPPSTEAPESPEEPLLGELTVTGSSQDSLSLSWTVPQGQFDRFLVQYKNGDGHPKVVRVPGTQDWVTISGLEPDHKYKVNLYGFHNGQHVGPISAFGVTDAVEETPTPTEPPSTETPEPPEESLLGELTVTGSSQDSLSLSWTVPQGHFDSFTIQYKDRDGQPQVVRVGGEEREVTVQGLDAGRKYKMHLYGLHGGQRVGPVSTVGVTDSETVTTQVSPTTTSEPPFKTLLGELTITDTTPDSLSLSWTITEGQFDRFLVQYKNGDGQPKVVRVPGTQDWVTITGLEPDHKYKVNLYGFHNGQRVGPISVFGVTDAVEETPIPTEPPSTEAPEPPEESLLGELTVTGSSQDSLSLSWTVPQGHFDSFTIQYKDKDGQPQVVRVGGEEREVTVRGLDAGHKYKMHLYGLHGGQRVGPVSTVGLTASLPTEPPVALSLGELTVVSVASDTVHLSWTVAQGPFDSFLVQYKDSQGQPQAVPVDGSLREVIVSGLDPARKYKFLLFGLQDEKKHGPVSTEAKTLPDKKPSPRLGDLTVTDVTPDSVGLLWTVPEGEFDSFVVQYKDKDRQPQVVPVAADQRKVTIPGLEPKKKYKFLLYGLAGRKRLGPVSAEGTTAPLEKELPPLPRLGELTLTDETPDSIHLSWTVAQGPFDSFVVQYRGTDGQPRAVPVAADEREVTIEGLEAGKKYKFLLFGLFRGQRLGPISGLGATASAEDTPIPGIPATEAPEGPRLGVLTVNSVAPDALRLSWSVAQGVFESFVIQYRDTDGKSQALLVDGDQSTVLVSSLEPSTPYMFSLYGLHGGKRLGPISAEGITGPAPPAGEIPGEPRPRLSQLSVTDVTTSSLRLNWEAPPGAFDSFLLRFGVPSQSSLEPYPRPLLQRELTVPGSRRSAAIRDLRPGTLYNLTLYGLRGPHKADSIQGSARTLSPVLESPHDLQFSEIGETSAKVSWTPPPSRVDSFKVSYQLADGGEPQSVRVDSRAQTQTLKGLAPGTRYEVTVVSIRGFEESEPLTGFFTTVSDGPTKLQALNLTEGSTVLHWDPPQNPVDTYDVQVTAPEAPSLQASAPGSAVDYPLSGLELHTNYTAMVRGLRGSNFTSPANITFTTGLEAPRDLEAKEVTPRTALLTWTEPPDPPTGYLLSFNTPGEQTQEILLPGGVTSHRLLGLFPSTTYNAFLRAVWGESFSPPMPTSFTTGGLRIPFPRDCGEEMQNGISTSRTTTIFLNGNRERPLDVFCDMETDGGGWLVFQRRMDGKTDFWRDWEDYAHGFGNISREFWLGNEALHSLTSSGDYSLRVDLRAGDEAVFAHYDSFRVDSAAKYYQLHLEGYHGTAGDSMTYHSGSVFSARDRDPNNLLISCAVSYRGAWWYRNCHYANLNGLYGSTVDHQGVSWYYWKGFGFSVPFTEMKLRPRNYHPPAWGG